MKDHFMKYIFDLQKISRMYVKSNPLFQYLKQANGFLW